MKIRVTDDRLNTSRNEAEYEDAIEDELVVFKVTDSDGNIIAGCNLIINCWKVADLDILWVDEPYRNQGIGSCLLSDIEREAKKNGACIVMIDARDWNVDFFKKLGYTVYCTLEDYPNGYSKYKLQKRQ